MKTFGIILAVLGAIAATVAAVFYIRKKGATVKPGEESKAPNGYTPSTTGGEPLNYDLILKKGSKGREVMELQELLTWGLKEARRLFPNGHPVRGKVPEANLRPDGNFGTLTESVLLWFLAKNNTTLREAITIKSNFLKGTVGPQPYVYTEVAGGTK